MHRPQGWDRQTGACVETFSRSRVVPATNWGGLVPRSRCLAAFWPLLALNFFMADVQAGIGPFLGVFLQAHGWKAGLIGTVITIGGVAGMLATAPAGAAIDATRHKRSYVIVCGVCTLLASGALLVSRDFWIV